MRNITAAVCCPPSPEAESVQSAEGERRVELFLQTQTNLPRRGGEVCAGPEPSCPVPWGRAVTESLWGRCCQAPGQPRALGERVKCVFAPQPLHMEALCELLEDNLTE